MQEDSKPNARSIIFRLYVIVIGIYAGFQFFLSCLMRIPACHRLTNQCDRWPLMRFIHWMREVSILLCSYKLHTCISLSSFFPLVVAVHCFDFLNFYIWWCLMLVHWRNDIMLDVACMREARTSSSKLSSSFFQSISICICSGVTWVHLVFLFEILLIVGGDHYRWLGTLVEEKWWMSAWICWMKKRNCILMAVQEQEVKLVACKEVTI